MKFTNLIKRFYKYQEEDLDRTIEFIKNGISEDADRGIRRYSTETRWNQYKAGEITREKAVYYAAKRAAKKIEKETAAKIAHLEKVAAAPDISFIRVSVEWSRSSYGSNPRCEVWTGSGEYYGRAGGWGYDKESAAVATAFNSSNEILKVLYTLKETALAAGGDDFSKSACTHVDNRNIIGYGSGYSVIPYFEGGVGVSCFWSILKKAGFEVRGEHGKKYDVYRLEKVTE